MNKEKTSTKKQLPLKLLFSLFVGKKISKNIIFLHFQQNGVFTKGIKKPLFSVENPVETVQNSIKSSHKEDFYKKISQKKKFYKLHKYSKKTQKQAARF